MTEEKKKTTTINKVRKHARKRQEDVSPCSVEVRKEMHVIVVIYIYKKSKVRLVLCLCYASLCLCFEGHSECPNFYLHESRGRKKSESASNV